MGDKTNADARAMRDTVNRLSRCEGHLRAIRRMVEDGRSCEALFVQLAAVRSALNEATLKVYERHLDHCLAEHRRGAVDRHREIKFISKLMLSGRA